MNLSRNPRTSRSVAIASLEIIISTLFVANLGAQSLQKTTAPPSVLSLSLRAGIDTTVSPCDDFTQYANGGWQAVYQDTPVHTWSEATAGVNAHIRRILDSARTNQSVSRDPALRMLGTFYTSCLDADSLPTRDTRGLVRPGTEPTRGDLCMALTRRYLGSALSLVYQSSVMHPAVIAEGQQLASQLRVVVRLQTERLAWLGDSVQRSLIHVIDTMKLRLPFAPDSLNFGSLTLSPTAYTENVAAIVAKETEIKRRRSKLRMKSFANMVIPPSYELVAQAYRGTPMIDVSAVFFQPPYFDVNAEPAANYATLGTILAHEMWHLLSPAFQWGKNTTGRERVTHVVEHYSQFSGSGWNTIREDLSDIGGILAAYAAWKQNPRQSAELLDGFTPDQRFFLYYARLWRSTGQPRADGTHSTAIARINGALTHIPAFAEAFGCKDSDAMSLPSEKRNRIF